MGDKVIVREELLAADFTEEVRGRLGRPFGLFCLYVILSSKFWVFFLRFTLSYFQLLLPFLELPSKPKVWTDHRSP